MCWERISWTRYRTWSNRRRPGRESSRTNGKPHRLGHSIDASVSHRTTDRPLSAGVVVLAREARHATIQAMREAHGMKPGKGPLRRNGERGTSRMDAGTTVDGAARDGPRLPSPVPGRRLRQCRDKGSLPAYDGVEAVSVRASLQRYARESLCGHGPDGILPRPARHSSVPTIFTHSFGRNCKSTTPSCPNSSARCGVIGSTMPSCLCSRNSSEDLSHMIRQRRAAGKSLHSRKSSCDWESGPASWQATARQRGKRESIPERK